MEMPQSSAPYNCDECSKHYTSSITLKIHKRRHQGVNPYHCTWCFVTFKNRAHLVKHIAKFHRRRNKLYSRKALQMSNPKNSHQKKFMVRTQTDDVKPYLCGYCNKAFTDRILFRLHEKFHEKQKSHICDQCQQGFRFKSCLRIHQKTHVKQAFNSDASNTQQTKKSLVKAGSGVPRTYSCQVCFREFNCKSNYYRHKKCHSDWKPHKCEICSKSFKMRQTLKEHMFTHSKLKPFQCGLCFKHFAQAKLLKAHLKTHSGAKPYKCEVCDKSYGHKKSLEDHSRLHTGERPFQCHICLQDFVSKGTYRRHVRNHAGGDARPFFCKICEKGYRNNGDLKRHLAIHAKGRVYMCNVCDAKFDNKLAHAEHLQTHDPKKPFKCPVCEVSFTRKANLGRHLLIHAERPDKIFECERCQKKFHWKTNLARHLKVHDEGKQHECELCQRRFTQRNSLSEHMRTHTGERPYECDVCHKRFSHCNTMRIHRKIHDRVNSFQCGVCNEVFRCHTQLIVHKMKMNHQDGNDSKEAGPSKKSSSVRMVSLLTKKVCVYNKVQDFNNESALKGLTESTSVDSSEASNYGSTTFQQTMIKTEPCDPAHVTQNESSNRETTADEMCQQTNQLPIVRIKKEPQDFSDFQEFQASTVTNDHGYSNQTVQGLQISNVISLKQEPAWNQSDVGPNAMQLPNIKQEPVDKYEYNRQGTFIADESEQDEKWPIFHTNALN